MRITHLQLTDFRSYDRAGRVWRGSHHPRGPQRPRQDQRGRGGPIPVDAVVAPRRDRRAAAAGRGRTGGRRRQGPARRAIADARDHPDSRQGEPGAAQSRRREAPRTSRHPPHRGLCPRGPWPGQGRSRVHVGRFHGRAVRRAAAGVCGRPRRLRPGAATALLPPEVSARARRGSTWPCSTFGTRSLPGSGRAS